MHTVWQFPCPPTGAFPASFLPSEIARDVCPSLCSYHSQMSHFTGNETEAQRLRFSQESSHCALIWGWHPAVELHAHLSFLQRRSAFPSDALGIFFPISHLVFVLFCFLKGERISSLPLWERGVITPHRHCTSNLWWFSCSSLLATLHAHTLQQIRELPSLPDESPNNKT